MLHSFTVSSVGCLYARGSEAYEADRLQWVRAAQLAIGSVLSHPSPELDSDNRIWWY